MLTILRLFSTLAALIQLAGLVLRVGVVATAGAIALRLSGLVAPEQLPAFWLMLGAAVLIVAPASWAVGHDEARREVRDAAIRRAQKEYEGG